MTVFNAYQKNKNQETSWGLARQNQFSPCLLKNLSQTKRITVSKLDKPIEKSD